MGVYRSEVARESARSHPREEGSTSMSLDQKRARCFGVLYLATFVTSIAALALYETVLRHPQQYILGAGHDTQILFGALLELLLIIANIGTAVVIFPIVRRLNEELALGYVPGSGSISRRTSRQSMLASSQASRTKSSRSLGAP